jgi:hypothetical protein
MCQFLPKRLDMAGTGIRSEPSLPALFGAVDAPIRWCGSGMGDRRRRALVRGFGANRGTFPGGFGGNRGTFRGGFGETRVGDGFRRDSNPYRHPRAPKSAPAGGFVGIDRQPTLTRVEILEPDQPSRCIDAPRPRIRGQSSARRNLHLASGVSTMRPRPAIRPSQAHAHVQAQANPQTRAQAQTQAPGPSPGPGPDPDPCPDPCPCPAPHRYAATPGWPPMPALERGGQVWCRAPRSAVAR